MTALHCADKVLEQKTLTVKDGKITGLSPFAVLKPAADATARLLTLSTCVSGGSRDNRLLVYAALLES